MKKHNVGIQAAIAVLLGTASISSFAGIAQGLTVNIADRAIISNATAFTTGSVAYSTAVPIPLGSFFVRVQLSGGTKYVVPAGLLAGSNTQLVVANQGAATVAVGDGTVSADQTFITFPVTITVQSAQVATTFTYKSAALGLNNAGYMATAGQVVAAAVSIGTSTAAPADIDSAASGNIVTSVPGLVALIASSGNANFNTAAGGGGVGATVEKRQIEVSNGNGTSLSGGASNTATTSLLNFGAIRLTDNPIARAADSTTVFNLVNNYAVTYGAVVTGNFSAAQSAGGRVFLATDTACTVPVAASPNATVTATTATFSGATAPATGVSQFVCMQLNTNNTVVVAETTPTVVATIAGLTAATGSFSSASGSLYPLVNNGGLLLVKSYIPAAQTGYTSFIRVINTGSVPAIINASVISPAGVVGTSVALTPLLAPNASVTLNSTQVEAAVGAIANAADRPTLRLTAPTKFKAQSFILTNANGNFAVVSAEETAP